MVTRLGLLVLGLVHVLNGAFMILAPERWYAAVPGVSMTGPLNHHFVADIGLAFLASGTGLLLGLRKGAQAAAFAAAGATWPVLHALLHISGWLQHGLPEEPAASLSEIIGVMAVGVLGAAAAWSRSRKETSHA